MSVAEEKTRADKGNDHHTTQGLPSVAARLQLDAFTIAALTGTPHHHDAGGFFSRVNMAAGGATRPSSGSPARSDATLDSIRDSSDGQDDKVECEDGSSVLSDELGEIAFTDDDDSNCSGSDTGGRDDASDGSGSNIVGDADTAGDGGPLRTTLLAEERKGNRAKWSGSNMGRSGESPAVMADRDKGRRGGEESSAQVGFGAFKGVSSETTIGIGQLGAHSETSKAARPTGVGTGTAATTANDTASNPITRSPPPPHLECNSVHGLVVCATSSGVEDGAPVHDPAADTPSSELTPVPETAQAASGGNGGMQHRPHGQTTYSPKVSDTNQDRQNHGSTTTTPALVQQPQRQHQPSPRASSGGGGDVVGNVTDPSNVRSCRVSNSDSPATPAAAAVAPAITVSGADSGGGGIFSAIPSGSVPTVTCKVLVVGNAKCGKSSIISRFVSNSFSADYNSTVGADYAMKDVALRSGRQVRLQLWDIAGQDRFAKLTRAYFRRAKGAVVVCDVTREGTFDAIVRWKEEIDLWCHNEGCELPVYLLANKCDLLKEVQESFLAGARMEKTCRDSGFAGWYITSAKRGDNINTAMTNLVEHALETEDRRCEKETEEQPSGKNHTELDGAGGSAGSSACPKKAEAFQLSSGGGRQQEGGFQGQQGACCQ